MDRSNADFGIAHQPIELLQQLIRFDTTNPPGNEADCIKFIAGIFEPVGLSPMVYARDPTRPNIIVRIPGRGEAAPLLVYAHVDVATTENQTWTYPPFEARIADGCIWGRGALDDKDGVAMSVCAVLRMKEQGWSPPGEIILAILSDEEQGGVYGARYLVENYPELFKGVRYAIGEVGGFTAHIGNRKFFPIMLAEKQFSVLDIILRGSASYATAAETRGGSAAKAGELLFSLEKLRLPVHITPVVKQMVETISANMPLPVSLITRQLFNPAITDMVLKLMGKQGVAMYPLFHNTCAVTGIHGGEQIITTPAKIVISLALGILPSSSLEEVINEIQRITKLHFEYEVQYLGEPSPERLDSRLFDTLGQILRESDPQYIPSPLLLTAFSDARFFNRLGIQTYGFQPVLLPPEIEFQKYVHAADERIPLEALEFGTNAIYKLLQRFG